MTIKKAEKGFYIDARFIGLSFVLTSISNAGIALMRDFMQGGTFEVNLNTVVLQDENGNTIAPTGVQAIAAKLNAICNNSSVDLSFLTTSPEFEIVASLGQVLGVTPISKFGENPDVDTGSIPEDIWSYGGLYNWSTTAAIDTFSSSEIADTQELVFVGQTADYVEVTQTGTLNGRNKVVLGTPLFRLYRVYNNNGVDLTGDIYVYEDTPIVNGVPTDGTKVRAYIQTNPMIPDNQSEMMIYTVPAGKTLVYKEGYIAMSRGNAGAADFVLRARLKDKVFRTKRRISLNSQGTGTWRAVYSVARVIPEKTDITFAVVNVTANNIGVAGGLEGYLFDNTIWNL